MCLWTIKKIAIMNAEMNFRLACLGKLFTNVTGLPRMHGSLDNHIFLCIINSYVLFLSSRNKMSAVNWLKSLQSTLPSQSEVSCHVTMLLSALLVTSCDGVAMEIPRVIGLVSKIDPSQVKQWKAVVNSRCIF